MDLFYKAKLVRLRSHHDKYLYAEEDKESVSQDRNGSIRNARWTVEFVKENQVLRLQSCYSRYLTATDEPFLLGVTGKKVFQTHSARLDSSTEWEPIRDGFLVKLKTRYGNFLRGNGGLPPWRNSVTHDVPHRSATQEWILWEVDIIDRVTEAPSRVLPTLEPSSTNANLEPPEETCTRKSDGRIIYVSVADEHSDVAAGSESKSFTFKGTNLQELTHKLKEETGMEDIIVCSKHPVTKQIFPLRLQLPPNNAAMHVIVVNPSSKLAKSFAISESLLPTTS